MKSILESLPTAPGDFGILHTGAEGKNTKKETSLRAAESGEVPLSGFRSHGSRVSLSGILGSGTISYLGSCFSKRPQRALRREPTGEVYSIRGVFTSFQDQSISSGLRAMGQTSTPNCAGALVHPIPRPEWVIFVLFPAVRILADVFPNPGQFSVIPDDMVVVSGLPREIEISIRVTRF